MEEVVTVVSTGAGKGLRKPRKGPEPETLDPGLESRPRGRFVPKVRPLSNDFVSVLLPFSGFLCNINYLVSL